MLRTKSELKTACFYALHNFVQYLRKNEYFEMHEKNGNEGGNDENNGGNDENNGGSDDGGSGRGMTCATQTAGVGKNVDNKTKSDKKMKREKREMRIYEEVTRNLRFVETADVRLLFEGRVTRSTLDLYLNNQKRKEGGAGRSGGRGGSASDQVQGANNDSAKGHRAPVRFKKIDGNDKLR